MVGYRLAIENSARAVGKVIRSSYCAVKSVRADPYFESLD
jgi:hypothetical protein